MATTTRTLYRDLVPYEIPSSLSALSGPRDGTLDVPVTVHWGRRHAFDLDDRGQLLSAYQAIVREGTPAVQEALLNEGLLRALWNDLVLPDRCRAVWEARFPSLAV